jgi:hypothetical protein
LALGQSGDKAPFSFDRERPFSFRQVEKKMGVQSPAFRMDATKQAEEQYTSEI